MTARAFAAGVFFGAVIYRAAQLAEREDREPFVPVPRESDQRATAAVRDLSEKIGYLINEPVGAVRSDPVDLNLRRSAGRASSESTAATPTRPAARGQSQGDRLRTSGPNATCETRPHSVSQSPSAEATEAGDR